MRKTPTISASEKLMAEWDIEKNKELGLDPYKLTQGSGYIAAWICPLGHKYDAAINSRKRGSGCPYCCNKKVLKGFNDLEFLYPDIASEWHPTLNGEAKPSDYTYGSGYNPWWLCPFKHEYQKPIHERIRGKGCPVCSRSLKTSFPEQAVYYYIKKAFPDAVNSYKDIFDNGMELDVYIPSINVGIEYDGSAFHGDNRVFKDQEKYRLCKEKGIILIRIYEYRNNAGLYAYSISDRNIEIPNGTNKYLTYAISTLCYKLGRPQDVDVNRDRFKIKSYLTAKRTSLKDEFPEIADEWDYEKNYPMLPEQFNSHANDIVNWICKDCGNKWPARISERTRQDGKSTGCPKCNMKNGVRKQIAMKLASNGSLKQLYPELIPEWDYEKNTIDPDKVLPGSIEIASWICQKCGYKWDTKIVNRTLKGHGCRLCSHQDTVAGINDLRTVRPDLVEEWDFERNEKGPEEYQEYSNQIVNWICKVCGHRWPAAIHMRAKNHGCPCCSGRVPKVGVNDLKTLRPDVAKDWDYDKNEKNPEEYKVKSHYTAFWKCTDCGYEWSNKIINRTRNPGCPECKKRKK